MREDEFRQQILDARAALGIDITDPSLAGLYERLLRHETLRPFQAAALIVGCDPETLTAEASLRQSIEGLAEDLAQRLNAANGDAELRVADAIQFAERAAVPMPASLGALFSFIQKTAISALTGRSGPFDIPGLNLSPTMPSARGADQAMVTLLGAALNLVANFRMDVVNSDGLVDPAKIAEAIETKAVRWFAEEPLPYSPAEIEDIVGQWLA